MNIYIGHHYGNPEKWFIAWGETKADAIHSLDADIEPDVRSMKKINDAGHVNFKVDRRDSTNTDDMEGDYYYEMEPFEIHFDGYVDEHIEKLRKNPLPMLEFPVNEPNKFLMQTSQQEILDTYERQKELSCEACKMVTVFVKDERTKSTYICSKCGYRTEVKK